MGEGEVVFGDHVGFAGQEAFVGGEGDAADDAAVRGDLVCEENKRGK